MVQQSIMELPTSVLIQPKGCFCPSDLQPRASVSVRQTGDGFHLCAVCHTQEGFFGVPYGDGNGVTGVEGIEQNLVLRLDRLRREDEPVAGDLGTCF